MASDLKYRAVKYMGGECVTCGYKRCMRALHFHHLDPFEKDFDISKYQSIKDWTKVKLELEKCVLVCANCHAEIHDGLVDHDVLREIGER